MSILVKCNIISAHKNSKWFTSKQRMKACPRLLVQDMNFVGCVLLEINEQYFVKLRNDANNINLKKKYIV
jgi:hypothetical protein